MGGFNLTLHFYNGAGDALVGTKVTISARDGRQKALGTQETDRGTITIQMPLSADTISNVFTLNASARGYRDAGYMGFRNGDRGNHLHLMLVERKAGLFLKAPEQWPAILSSIEQDQFLAFSEQADGLPAACLLNVLEAIRLCDPQMLAMLLAVPLEVDRLETFRDRRKPGVCQDRVLLHVKPDLKDLLVRAGFHRESSLLHGKPRPDEEAVSYKQQDFPYGNLQFTLFTKKTALECYADIDMDYHRDKVSHAVLEVLPNLFGSRTDPRKVYGLRWMAAKNAGQADFEPAYELAENL